MTQTSRGPYAAPAPAHTHNESVGQNPHLEALWAVPIKIQGVSSPLKPELCAMVGK